MTAVLERRMDDTTEPLGWPPSPRREPSAGPLLAVAGLVCMALAAAVLSLGRPAPEAPPETGGPEVVLTSGTYERGHSSGWHVHPGLHSVVVVTGSLTVYDHACASEHVGPGEAYLGGDRPHLIRNERAEPATYVVTYARMPSAALDPGTTVPPPTPCDLR